MLCPGLQGASFGLEWERDCVSIEERAQSVCEDLQWVEDIGMREREGQVQIHPGDCLRPATQPRPPLLCHSASACRSVTEWPRTSPLHQEPKGATSQKLSSQMGSDTYIYTNFFVALSNLKESSEEQVTTF